MKIRTFTSSITNEEIGDLKDRIKRARWPDAILESGWNYGTDIDYLKELCDFWCHGYSWRKTEDEINSYPNFIAEIDGFNIHFIHVKGKAGKRMPLIITHGWPGSFMEMLKMIPLLTCDPEFSFDVVLPSVIGFGFSSKATRPGCNNKIIAELWHKLMTGLGYERYGVQGGDIGAGISIRMAKSHPESISGLHLNFISGSYKPYIGQGEILAPEVIDYQRIVEEWSAREGAYNGLQSTKPQTLAFGLNDSPVGLCAWILEKFYSWSDHSGMLENVISKEELLGNVSLYWFTHSMPSSIRVYKENMNAPLVFAEGEYIKTPVGYARFPKELPTPPRSYIEKVFNIRQWTDMPIGGHFAALEQPVLLSSDIRKFFQNI